jgi:hypothetical protein
MAYFKLTGKKMFYLIKMVCVPGGGDVQNTHVHDEEVRNTESEFSWNNQLDQFH